MQFYSLYLRIFYSSAVARQKQLKSEILLNKKELLQTSAQDQFAKWAKLRRSVDKGLADLEKLSEFSASLPASHLITTHRSATHSSTTPEHPHTPTIFAATTLTARPPYPRWRARDGPYRLLAQVQQRAVVHDDRPAVLHRLVVPQSRGLLPAPRLVRAPDVVARAALRARGLRLVRRVADGVPARHQGWGAHRARGDEPNPRFGFR